MAGISSNNLQFKTSNKGRASESIESFNLRLGRRQQLTQHSHLEEFMRENIPPLRITPDNTPLDSAICSQKQPNEVNRLI